MKNIILLCCLFFLSFFVYSQEPLKHEKKDYVDKNGRYYVNIHLPVYLRLSHSPNDNAPSHLLRSETSPKYSNPFYFDMEGYNTIRTPWQVDTVTKKPISPKENIIFEVYADGTAPKIKPRWTNATKYLKDGKTFFGKGLRLELKATDNVAGVENIYVSLNGAAFQPYKEILDFSQEGDYTLKYYSVDNVGNVSEVTTEKFTVDVTPPITERTIQGDAKGSTLSVDATIVLSSRDDLSGVKNTYFSVDGRAPVLYTRPIPLALLGGGNHSVIYYSLDNVHNNNARNDKDLSKNTPPPLEFLIDDKGPDVNLTVVGDKYEEGKNVFVSERTQIKLEAKDEHSNVEVVSYGVDAEATTIYTSPFFLLRKKGSQIVNYLAMDELKNFSENKFKTFFMDNLAPASSITYGKPQLFDRDTLFISKKTTVTLTCRDGESGVAKLEYSIDGEAFKNYSQFNIQQEGFHTITFKGTDKVNNSEQTKESKVLVDNTPPEIFVKFSIEPIREETRNGEKLSVYPTYTKMYIAATDRYVGTEKIFYSINNGPMQNYASVKNIAEANLLTKEQVYSVKVVSIDQLGNESTKIIKFIISSK